MNNGCSTNQGKLLMIDQSDYLTQHIFFDDGVVEGEASSVDIRDVVTGADIPYEKAIDMYIVKVHPTRAILEMDYFIKMIESAESKRDEEI